MPSSYWLIKSDPDTYSFHDLLREGKTTWDGIRNHQARGYLARMSVGDDVLVYHSGKELAIVGTARVVRGPYPDPRADDPRWLNVDLEAGQAFSRPVALAELKADPVLSKLLVVKQSRLSVSPVTPPQWRAVKDASRRAP